MLTLVPWYYKALAVVALIAVLTTGYLGWKTHQRNIGRIEGKAAVQALWDIQKKKDIQADLDESIRQAKETSEVVIKYVDRVRIIKEKSKTIVREVPIYVDAKADADCIVNNGFVVLHEAAIAGEYATALRSTFIIV